MVEKLLQTASLAGQRRNLRVASNCLRRAYSICTKRADAGLLAGRAGEALEEALKAIREAEEVWSILQDKSEDLQTPLAQRALVLIQAKHCVAIELEYTLADKMQSSQASMIREMIPALHEEAAALARLLPERSALRKVSFRTKAQEASRRAAEPDAHGAPVGGNSARSLVTIAEGHAAESCPPGFAWREPTELALELFERPEHFYEQQAPEHVPERAAFGPRASVQAVVEPLAGANAAAKRSGEAAKVWAHQRWWSSKLPVVEQQEELPQAQARAGSRRRGRHARGEKPNYSAGMWWKRREDPGKDVFQQWLLATAAKDDARRCRFQRSAWICVTKNHSPVLLYHIAPANPATPTSMLPSFMAWEGTGQPWQKGTPESRLATVALESDDLPPPPTLPPPPKPVEETAEVAPEVKAHIESLQKSMGSAFTPKLEQDIIAAAKMPAKAQSIEITHTDLNKAKQARNQYDAAKKELKKIDEKWVQFNQGLQQAYNCEHEEYKCKRKAADLYENKILSSHYGVKVRSQARKEAAQKEGKEVKEEKVVRSKTHRRPSTNPTLLSVKSMATRLQDSQNAIPETKETREFLYMLRREQGNEIYEEEGQAQTPAQAVQDFLGPFASILGRWIDAKGGASDDDQSNASNGGGSDAGGPCGMTVEKGELQVVMYSWRGSTARRNVKKVEINSANHYLFWRPRFTLDLRDFGPTELRWRYMHQGFANHWHRERGYRADAHADAQADAHAEEPADHVAEPNEVEPGEAELEEGDAEEAEVKAELKEEHEELAYLNGRDRSRSLRRRSPPRPFGHRRSRSRSRASRRSGSHGGGRSRTELDGVGDHHLPSRDHDATMPWWFALLHQEQVTIEIVTCGLRDLQRCGEEGGGIIDMRSFYDPGCGPLKRHDGHHHEIIRRLVHHHLFKDLVCNLRDQLADCLRQEQDDCKARFVLYCKSGNLLHYILLCEGFSGTQLQHESLGEGCSCAKCSKPSGQRCLACEEGLRKWRNEAVNIEEL
eukprot:g26104.t1